MDKAKVFIMWLDGFLDGRDTLDEKQTLTIKNKLDGIFDHEAMDNLKGYTKPTLVELGEIHGFNVHKNTFGEENNNEDNVTYRC